MSIQRAAILFLVVIMFGRYVCGDEADSLSKRIKAQEVKAIREAGRQGRKDLIPLLKEIYAIPMAPQEPVHISAQSALAKLGEEKYLVDILQELLQPATAPAFENEKRYALMCGASDAIAEASAAWDIAQAAFRKLAYIEDERTIQYIARLLYETKPLEVGHLADGPLTSKSTMAVEALSQMIHKDVPMLEGMARFSNQAMIIAWQKWWETHKDYYEKLKPILVVAAPTPPAATNQVSQPRVAATNASPTSKSNPVSMPAPVQPESSVSPLLLFIGAGALVLVAVAVALILRRKGTA